MQFDFKHDFGNDTIVICPSCSKKAVIVKQPADQSGDVYKFTCVHCGANKSLFTQLAYLKYPLWYSTVFNGNTLAAINLKHLAFLKTYIGEKLRERRPDENGWSNQSLQSRLPKWMLSAANREQLIKKIEELENK